MSDNLISLTEYAKLHGIAPANARLYAKNGKYKTARKIGRNWVIDRDEPHTDNRIKHGKYIGVRNKNK